MNFNGKLDGWCKGDQEATAFLLQLWTATQQWDDIEDEGDVAQYNTLLSWLAFGKEYQPFFERWAHILRPVLLQMYLSWRAANVLERGDKNDVAKAYMLRAQFYSVIHMVTWILAGDEWAVECGPDIWRTYGETPDEIWREFNDA